MLFSTILFSIIYIVVFILLIYVSVSTVYLLFLALAFYYLPPKTHSQPYYFNNFAVLVPAHNEEMLVGNLCQSLLHVDYPQDKYEIFVIADNCSDSTIDICRQHPVHILERKDPDNVGKGQALAWALQQINLAQYEALLIVDADNYVDPAVLRELNILINSGEQAIQCYNAVGNRDDSWFTQLLYVSRTIGNLLYHEAKYRLGLSSYLMGNGLCFSADLLREKGWTAFSTGEDWEYYAQLVESGIKIGFAAKAKVLHQESRSLNQATSQRLRWASGRFKIAKTLGWPLMLKGFKRRDWWLIDASLPLIFPNYSLLVNMTLMGCVLSFIFLPTFQLFIIAFSVLFVGQFFLFCCGIFIAGSVLKVFCSLIFAPFFLAWKGMIDILSVLGIYKSKVWIRTRRH